MAGQIILDVCTAIWDALASIHLPVPSDVEWHSIADDFFARWNFTNCIGIIDGKHVMIQCPVYSGSLFYNYKSYFSIVLLAVPHVLLGDEAFPLCCDLMQPFARNALTNERCIFNYRLSRAREVVEIAFGILANWWRIFHWCINLNPNNVTTVVKANCTIY